MSKLFVIIALLVGFLIIKNLINNKTRSKNLNETRDATSQTESLDYKQTVQCDYCGTHVPLATAYKSGEQYFCDESHASADKT